MPMQDGKEREASHAELEADVVVDEGVAAVHAALAEAAIVSPMDVIRRPMPPLRVPGARMGVHLLLRLRRILHPQLKVWAMVL